MRKTKILTLIFTIFILISAASCSNENQGASTDNDDINIGIIQYADHIALASAKDGFIDALEENGFKDGENIIIDLQNAQGDQSNLGSISDRFVGNNADLVLAIATPAAQAIAGKTTDIPILATAVTDFEAARLVNSNESPGGNITGTSDMNPIKEQIDLLAELIPEAETVGVIYTSSEDNSILQASIAKEAIEALGLNYEEVTVTNSNDVQQAVQSIVEKCDVLYIPTDNILSASMPVVSGVTSEFNIPTICGESAMLENGGFATLGINYYDLGYQTGLMALKIMKGEAEPAAMPVERLSEFDHAINGAAAEELGIDIPEHLQEFILAE